MRTAIRAYLPMRVERTTAGRTDIAHLGVAHGADDKVLLDRSATLRAGAILSQLTLAQRHVELLLLAIGEIGVGAKRQIGNKASKRDERHEAPDPKRCYAATTRIDEHIGHRERIERDDEADER